MGTAAMIGRIVHHAKVIALDRLDIIAGYGVRWIDYPRFLRRRPWMATGSVGDTCSGHELRPAPPPGNSTMPTPGSAQKFVSNQASRFCQAGHRPSEEPFHWAGRRTAW